MWSSHSGTRKRVRAEAHGGAKVLLRPLSTLYFLLTLIACMGFGLPGLCQDSGSEISEFRGNGVEITVTVRDGTGEPLRSEAMVRVLRDGSTPSAQGQTSRGLAVLIVKTLGDFTVVVKAAGYEDAQKDFSMRVSGRVEMDVVLRRISTTSTPVGVPGRPILAPKAKKAMDKGLEALGENKTSDAEKYVDEAMRLAPGHPDVLYLQGLLYLREQKWADAQSALEKATQADANHAQAYAALGMSLCDQGKFPEAVAPLEKSLQLNAIGSWEARWSLAKAYYQSGRYEDALKTSQEALTASNGKAPEIALLVAQSLTAVGRYDEAAQTLQEFLKDHGDRKEAGTARRWLERLAASGKIQKN